MSLTKEIWEAYSWHCPNCGKVSTGFQNEEGIVKIECPRCHAVMLRHFVGRRHDRLEIYDSEEALCSQAHGGD